MARVRETQISCGVYQLFGLDAESHVILKKLMAAYKGQASRQGRKRGFAQVILSDSHQRQYERHFPLNGLPPILPRAQWTTRNGTRFVNYLRKNFPSIQITELKSLDSPSTGNDITTWIVNIPHAAFRKHKFYSKVKGINPRNHDYDDGWD